MASDPLIGSTVAGYRIESRIGRGGMSRVYCAEHLRLGRRDALKLLSLELMKDGSFRERFEREWRVAAGIDHPNIIPVFDAGEADGHFSTVDYAAPEQIQGSDSLDARTDVYGLGCVAYECLSGARPYQRASDLQLMYAHLEDPPPRITDVRAGGSGGQPAVLTLTLDGRKALTARDRESPYADGATGLIVESFDRGGVRVSFDDFVVRRAD